MEAFNWFAAFWHDLANNLGVISLLFAGYQLRLNSKATRISNLIALNQHHNAIWSELTTEPGLSRIQKPDADISKYPITDKEWNFVRRVMLHLDTSRRARKAGTLGKLQGLPKDIRDFFEKPIPREVWKHLKEYQDEEFVRFVERARVDNSKV